MPENRTINMGGIWAEGAPDLSATPVGGVTYANESLSEETINTGWPYSEIVNSATFNEVLRRITFLMELIETWGIIPWSPNTNYSAGSRAMGTDGLIYKSLQDNNLNKIPQSSASWWGGDEVSTHAALAAAHGAVDTATASKIVLRDSNADIRGRMFRAEHATAYGACNYVMGQVALGTGDVDNYVRPMTMNHLRNLLLYTPTAAYLKNVSAGFFVTTGGIMIQFGRYSGGPSAVTLIPLPTTFPTVHAFAFGSRGDMNMASYPVAAKPYGRSNVQVVHGFAGEDAVTSYLCIGW